MSSFLAYNTDDPNATAAGFTPLPANQSVTVGPVVSGGASKIAGSCYSDTAGTLWIQQSFDGIHWDVQQPSPTGQAISAGVPYTIDFDVLAPQTQVVFTNGTTAQAHLRIFVRVFGPGR